MEKRAALLEKAAAGAPDAFHASTFDAHRTDTYMELGQPEKARAMLAAREAEFPADYNPPARLARVLLEMKRTPEAKEAIERALSKMPLGQRRVGVLGLKAKILTALGESTTPVLREQLAVLRQLPAPQRRPEAEAKLEKDIAAAEGAKVANP